MGSYSCQTAFFRSVHTVQVLFELCLQLITILSHAQNVCSTATGVHRITHCSLKFTQNVCKMAVIRYLYSKFLSCFSPNLILTKYKKCKTNQKQQLSTKKLDIKLRLKSLEYRDNMLTIL